MQNLMPPPTDIAPPPPPAPPKTPGEPSGRRSQVIIPCPGCSNIHTRHINRASGFITFTYYWMMRVELTSMEVMGHEHICSRKYRLWLQDLEHQYPDLPPHISFGGRIDGSEGNEKLFAEWKEYAKRKFAW